MAEYIDKSALYEKIAQLEEIARNRYLETPSSNPCCSRYMTQLNERTVFKRIIADFPAADVAPVQHGRWINANSRPKTYERRCTACGGRAYFCGVGCSYKYCPNCGAKMDLEDER